MKVEAILGLIAIVAVLGLVTMCGGTVAPSFDDQCKALCESVNHPVLTCSKDRRLVVCE